MRVCSVEECTNKHQARGLCSTHYNQRFQPNRHRKVEQPCAVCGKLVAKERSSVRRPTCSEWCRTTLNGAAARKRWLGATGDCVMLQVASRILRDAAKDRQRESRLPAVAGASCEIPVRHPARWVWPSRWWAEFYVFSCAWCGSVATATIPTNLPDKSLPRHCSKACARKNNKQLFRSSPILLKWVTDRDGWDCQLCGEPVDKTLSGDPVDPWSPTLDHVIPQSMGGSDDVENLRLAHRWCNQVRGAARTEAEQFFSDMRRMSSV